MTIKFFNEIFEFYWNSKNRNLTTDLLESFSSWVLFICNVKSSAGFILGSEKLDTTNDLIHLHMWIWIDNINKA